MLVFQFQFTLIFTSIYSLKFTSIYVQFTLIDLQLIITVNQPAFTCPKLTVETLEQGVKYVQYVEHISHLVLVFLLLTVNM